MVCALYYDIVQFFFSCEYYFISLGLKFTNFISQFNGGNTDVQVTDYQEDVTYSQLFDEASFEIGTRCQFSMASTKRMVACSESGGRDCFCFDPLRIKYSQPATCVVQGEGAIY